MTQRGPPRGRGRHYVIGKMTTFALIPARGGSKGIPRKNLAPLAGRPLVELPASVRLSRALRALLPTRVFDRVVGDGFGVYRSMEAFRGRD